MHLSPEKEAPFPNLRRENYRVTSEADWKYNCIAHAAGKDDAPWWPAVEGTEGVSGPRALPEKSRWKASWPPRAPWVTSRVTVPTRRSALKRWPSTGMPAEPPPM